MSDRNSALTMKLQLVSSLSENLTKCKIRRLTFRLFLETDKNPIEVSFAHSVSFHINAYEFTFLIGWRNHNLSLPRCYGSGC